MRKNTVLLLVSLYSQRSPRLFADIAAIHANALPQETAVLRRFSNSCGGFGSSNVEFS